MRHLSLALLLFLFLLIRPPDVSASMRCGRLLVSVGDHQAEVLQKCGFPALTDRRISTVVQDYSYRPGWRSGIEEYREIVIDEWIYNFGPRQFMRHLRFENGILKEIRELGYGY